MKLSKRIALLSLADWSLNIYGDREPGEISVNNHILHPPPFSYSSHKLYEDSVLPICGYFRTAMHFPLFSKDHSSERFTL
jgi:hypothetical protein